jgi:hypothetical protein
MSKVLYLASFVLVGFLIVNYNQTRKANLLVEANQLIENHNDAVKHGYEIEKMILSQFVSAEKRFQFNKGPIAVDLERDSEVRKIIPAELDKLFGPVQDVKCFLGVKNLSFDEESFARWGQYEKFYEYDCVMVYQNGDYPLEISLVKLKNENRYKLSVGPWANVVGYYGQKNLRWVSAKSKCEGGIYRSCGGMVLTSSHQHKEMSSRLPKQWIKEGVSKVLVPSYLNYEPKLLKPHKTTYEISPSEFMKGERALPVWCE